MQTFIATFFSHFGAIRFNKQLKEAGIQGKLMPVPRRVSSSCGTCAVFTPKNGELPEAEFASLSFEKLFKISEDAGKYELLIENE